MRTTIDMPEEVYRKAKALAAVRGEGAKEMLEHAIGRQAAEKMLASKEPYRVQFPIIRKWKGPKLDLTDFDFDELLG